jgi:hypothetical protein
MDAPTPEDVRSALASLDAQQQKIVAGMLTVMIKEPKRVQDREWMALQLTELTLLAGEFAADTPDAGVRAVQDYLEANSVELLRASFLLFQRVALDLEPRVSAGFTFEEALRSGLEYMPPAGKKAKPDKREVARDLGEQPLADLMAKRGLKASDLVTASTEQITHKMVTRALKGRRLTANTMGKIVRAWGLATDSTPSQGDLFNYAP